jgi:hypothetical protein
MPQPLKDATLALNAFLSPTNINSLIQFGILLKGIDLAKTFAGVKDAMLLADTAIKVWAIDGWAAVAPTAALAIPIIALAAAFLLLIDTINQFGKGAMHTLNGLAILFGGSTGIYSQGEYAARIKGWQSEDTGAIDPNLPTLMGSLKNLTGKAYGGRVNAGGAYMVGEQGPELFSPSTNGTIIPHGAIGGTTVINLTYAPAISMATKDEFEEKLLPFIRGINRRLATSG